MQVDECLIFSKSSYEFKQFMNNITGSINKNCVNNNNHKNNVGKYFVVNIISTFYNTKIVLNIHLPYRPCSLKPSYKYEKQRLYSL